MVRRLVTGALGMLPEGTGVDTLHVHGANPLHQQELQDACSVLAQNPRSTNSHFCPVVPGCHSPCPLVSPAVAADSSKDNSANLAAGPTVPQVNCTAPPNVANGVHTPFLCPLNVPCIAAGGAAGGGAAVPPPPTANNLLRLILVRRVLPTTWRQAGSASSALRM